MVDTNLVLSALVFGAGTPGALRYAWQQARFQPLVSNLTDVKNPFRLARLVMEKTAHVMLVDGLSRNGRDFDAPAEAMSRDYRVLCPDFVGRGKSNWLQNKAGYGYPQYLFDMSVLIAPTGADGPSRTLQFLQYARTLLPVQFTASPSVSLSIRR